MEQDMDEAAQPRTERPSIYRLLAIAGYTAYSNSLVGSQAPKVAEYFERIRNPQAGDLVVETSTIHHEDWNPAALGWLLDIADEPVETEEEHRAMLAEGDYWKTKNEGYDAVPLERVWCVEPLDPDAPCPFRWHNADFISIPGDLQI